MKFNDERLIFGSKISDRIIRDNNQQLICNDCILSRTGYYEYLESEIMQNGDPNKIVKVYRTEKEVFDPRSIASFENKPLCDDHPDEDVTLMNYKDLQKGFIKNVRRGTGKYTDCLLCDIVVTDEETIDKILSREKRELSAGYDARIVKNDNNEYQMVDIRGNHLALVNSGRAGCATIRDSASRFINKNGGKEMGLFSRKPTKTMTRLFDGDIVEVEEISDDELDETLVEEPAQPDFQAQLDELKQRVEALEAKCASTEVSDEEEVPKEEDAIENEDEVISDNEIIEENEEVISDDEDEIVEETEDYVEDDDDVDELIDADEVSEDKETEEEVKPVKDSKPRKVQNTYAKFATNLKDERTKKSKSVQVSFQERYNKASRG